jgi:hypothetical protein
VASLIGLGVLSIFLPLARILLLAEVVIYLSVMVMAGLLSAARRRALLTVLGLPMAIATMHLSWGSGFLWSLLFGRAA